MLMIMINIINHKCTFQNGDFNERLQLTPRQLIKVLQRKRDTLHLKSDITSMIWIKLQCSSKESNCLHIASANESDLCCYDYNRLIEICQFREMVKREKIKMTRHIFLHLFPPKMVFFETSNKVLEGFKSAMFPSLISTSLNFHDLTLKWSFSLPLSLIADLKILSKKRSLKSV